MSDPTLKDFGSKGGNHVATAKFGYARARKAWNAAVTATVGVAGTVSVASLFTDSGIDGAAVGAAAGLAAATFVGTFVTTYLTGNKE
ncbi:hypothetical protein [Curtobacterium phage Reje]|uniref:hypothetical protein n=1 Tax=Curtobacterium phage Reje TaxID=2851069 RepID=UPI00220B77A0|nr:hypothetical protein QEJ62_gp15 [Curtobacterium phage Reje]QXG07823.1 hypothetical protein [Curtobacterium phage Reje]